MQASLQRCFPSSELGWCGDAVDGGALRSGACEGVCGLLGRNARHAPALCGCSSFEFLLPGDVKVHPQTKGWCSQGGVDPQVSVLKPACGFICSLLLGKGFFSEVKAMPVDRETLFLFLRRSYSTAWSRAAAGWMQFMAVSDAPCALHSAGWLCSPLAFAPGQHRLLDYGGCHFSSLSLAVRGSPVLHAKLWKHCIWLRNSLQGW